MVAPGDNLDFQFSDYFAKRVKPVPQIAEAVVAYLKEWPNLGVLSAGGMRKVELEYQGRKFLVLTKRKRNRIVLCRLFEMPHEEKMLEEALADLERLSKE